MQDSAGKERRQGGAPRDIETLTSIETARNFSHEEDARECGPCEQVSKERVATSQPRDPAQEKKVTTYDSQAPPSSDADADGGWDGGRRNGGWDGGAEGGGQQVDSEGVTDPDDHGDLDGVTGQLDRDDSTYHDRSNGNCGVGYEGCLSLLCLRGGGRVRRDGSIDDGKGVAEWLDSNSDVEGGLYGEASDTAQEATDGVGERGEAGQVAGQRTEPATTISIFDALGLGAVERPPSQSGDTRIGSRGRQAGREQATPGGDYGADSSIVIDQRMNGGPTTECDGNYEDVHAPRVALDEGMDEDPFGHLGLGFDDYGHGARTQPTYMAGGEESSGDGAGCHAGGRTVEVMWDALSMKDVPFYGNWVTAESAHEPEGRAQLGGGIGGGKCASCGVDLLAIGAWRICRCSAAYCLECAVGTCGDCSAMWDCRDTESERAVQPECEAAAVASAPRFTPREAAARRREMADREEVERRQNRRAYRETRAAQWRNGRRLLRRKKRATAVTFISANVSGFGSLQEQMVGGSGTLDCDFLLFQEHARRGEQRVMAERALQGKGWDVVSDDAYIKTQRCGGGTGIASRFVQGIRPLATPGGQCEGRLTLGMTDLDGDCAICCVYGIAGQDAAHQLPIWLAMLEALKRIGRPFVAGGDWQRPPADLERTGIPKLLGATVIAPRAATNLLAGSKLDWFLVSDSLLDRGWRVDVVHGTSLATHVPVRLTLDCEKVAPQRTRRIAQPRPLPVYRPVGPQVPAPKVDWQGWEAASGVINEGTFDECAYSTALNEWYAAAELELHGIFGTFDTPEEARHSGIGAAPRIIEEYAHSRYRDVPDQAGILGQRLAWAARALHLVVKHADAIASGEGAFREHRETLARLGHRACAFANERLKPAEDIDDREMRGTLLVGLRRVASLVRSCRGRPPGLQTIAAGGQRRLAQEAAETRDRLQEHLDELLKWRRRKAAREAVRWARAASIGQAHGATRVREAVTRKTASASKGHKGECTAQQGADAGGAEWGTLWGATASDSSSAIMAALDAMECVDRDYPEFPLPPISDERLMSISARFRGGTGLGMDALRPHHIALLSKSARKGLAAVLMAVERAGRWPAVVRWVTSVALGKKLGGARLIGLSTTLYRVWARLRYVDCRGVLEQRIARPFFAAAPGRGADRAAFEMSLAAEAAEARDDTVAAASVDIEKFYEHITVADYAEGALRQGVPKCVVLLTAHLYLGPRVIRVDNAVSAPLFPRRSIVAGCGWATLLVRVMMLPSIDVFMVKLHDLAGRWGVRISTCIYVDDGVLMTTGARDPVVMVHTWAVKMLLAYVQTTLGKKVAKDKLACVASTAGLRERLGKSLGEIGFRVGGVGEILGTDFHAGRAVKSGALTRARVAKALKRGPRLRWLRKLGGRAGEVVRGGATPQIVYGASSRGVRPAVMRRIRILRGITTRVRCGGSSLTARLAVGGPRWEEADPQVLMGIPPLQRILDLIWDCPKRRSDVIDAWRRNRGTREEVEPAKAWAANRGPVSAARAHLLDIGASWGHPFVLTLNGHNINVLEVPPRQVRAILQDHIRQHLDAVMLERMCRSKGWDAELVMDKYRHGVDWRLARGALAGKMGHLSPAGRRLIEVLMADGFWYDTRRWHAGYAAHGTCRACLWEQGGAEHVLHGECSSMAAHIAERRASQLVTVMPRWTEEAGLNPLRELGLPPRLHPWRPQSELPVEGHLVIGGGGGYTFGDGSAQRVGEHRLAVATWAVVRTDREDGDGDAAISEAARGTISGWFPTAPRAEIKALEFALRHLPPGGYYVGDCQHVLDEARSGVSDWLCSSRSINADLWREVRRRLEDVEDVVLVKTRAHRSRAQAEADIEGDGVWYWQGNRASDQHCNVLSRALAAADTRANDLRDQEEAYVAVLGILASSLEWWMRNVPDSDAPRTVRRGPQHRVNGGGPDIVGGHTVVPNAGGGSICVHCKLCCWSTAGRRWLRQKPCRGAFADQVHGTHQMSWQGGVAWCRRCGAYTTRMPRRLLEPCVGRPATAAQANVRRRLLAGLPPTTAKYLLHGGHTSAADVARARPQSGLPALTSTDVLVGAHHERDGFGAEGNAAVDALVDRAVDSSRYRRLELRRRQEKAMEEAAGQESTGAPCSSGPARAASQPPLGLRSQPLTRHTGKQPQRSRSADRRRQRLQECCRPTSAAGWTARVQAAVVQQGSSCHLCSRRCSTRCRGCKAPLCVDCAKVGSHCKHSLAR